MAELAALGKEVQVFENEPILPEYLYYYVNAFRYLSATRSYGLAGPLPITMTDMLSYVALFGVDDVETFVHHMMVMDQAILIAEAAKNGES